MSIGASGGFRSVAWDGWVGRLAQQRHLARALADGMEWILVVMVFGVLWVVDAIRSGVEFWSSWPRLWSRAECFFSMCSVQSQGPGSSSNRL